MKFVTTSQTPVYIKDSNGFYRMTRSLPIDTPVQFAQTGFDDKSGRPIGIFANGEIMYLDTLVNVLDEVVVKDTRLWDWLLYIGLAVGTIYYITKED